ncbi:LacI family DNA-binding transcriptional regulator [Nonomuraea turcica]|uniref:LacI family DNA-binding transcriptional regulator n=1 Tax=Nonomuraea sp. G32 TaxID=3067274 RepID=UPI00273AA29B|nr:LacI family DNA-binding transcriptional regulator [Nonomuraea sp. G32]MDP4509856.1 LacI family DNA-binding transcriptional regulator [Nonomuraea sp. G32]
MTATIKDVARACGVHVSTVSRTFSAPHLVNPATRSKVMAVADDLGYRPNRAARALTTGRTFNMGLIVADISNPFFPPLIKAAQAQARGRDYHVFVADTDEDPRVEEELIRTFTKQVDGVLLCSPRLSNRMIERLAEDVPFVVINRRIKGMPAVLMNVAQGAKLALEHLTGLGHRKIALVSGPIGSWTSNEMQGVAAEAPGLDLVFFGPNQPTESGGLAVAADVAACGATAVLAYNDLVALGLIEGLAAMEIGVPDQISVVGFDDILPGRLNRPKLTTVAMPAVAAGRMAVDLLLQSGGEGATVTLDTALIVRESTGRAQK